MRGLAIGAATACFIGAAVLARAAAPISSSAQAETILADVKAQGARRVVADLYASSQRWNQILENIGRGDRKWLEVAAALRPGTDAGASEALDEAAFIALKHAPAAVLRLLKDGRFETKAVCSSNIGTDYPADQSRRFIGDRIKILKGISDGETLSVRDQCLAGLQVALTDFGK